MVLVTNEKEGEKKSTLRSVHNTAVYHVTEVWNKWHVERDMLT